MSKSAKTSAKKLLPKSTSARKAPAKPSRPAVAHSGVGAAGDKTSKQELVIAMLRSPAGTTIAAIGHATGWQQHSVRGFLAGVVRKKLKLSLHSSKVGGQRTYRITGEDNQKPVATKPTVRKS